MQGHGRIIAPDFYVAHREANSGLSTLNRTKSILSIYHQQSQLQKQRGMCLNDTYPFCQQPLSGNCHSICFSKPVLWTATPRGCFFTSRSCILPLQERQEISCCCVGSRRGLHRHAQPPGHRLRQRDHPHLALVTRQRKGGQH